VAVQALALWHGDPCFNGHANGRCNGHVIGQDGASKCYKLCTRPLALAQHLPYLLSYASNVAVLLVLEVLATVCAHIRYICLCV
jgi:hypothetical protein